MSTPTPHVGALSYPRPPSDGHWGGAVGKRNREKRAAKKRARQQRRSTPPRSDFGVGPHGPGCTCGDHVDPGAYPPPIPPAEQLAQAMLAAARTGDPTEASACASELANG